MCIRSMWDVARHGSNRLRVVIVDDNDKIVKVASRLLGRLPVEVLSFASAEAALRHLEDSSTTVDVLWTDLDLDASTNGADLLWAASRRAAPPRSLLLTGSLCLPELPPDTRVFEKPEVVEAVGFVKSLICQCKNA